MKDKADGMYVNDKKQPIGILSGRLGHEIVPGLYNQHKTYGRY